MEIEKTVESIKSYFPALLWISLDKNIVLAPSIPHFKGLDMRNLQYEIRVCQKIHNKVTLTISSYFDFGQFCQFPDTHVQLAIFQHFYKHVFG